MTLIGNWGNLSMMGRDLQDSKLMAEIRNCENCTKPIDVPSHALNKRFCSDKCRNDWHNSRTRRAKEALAVIERKDAMEQL